MIHAIDVDVPAWLVVACLYLLALLCWLGLVLRTYHENWAQAIGMSGTLIWSLGRADAISNRIDDGIVTVGAYQLIGVLSVLCFALGTAWKVWQFRGRGGRVTTAHDGLT